MKHGIHGMPWDTVYGKRKAEARETAKNEEREVNAGPQAVLGTIYQCARKDSGVSEECTPCSPFSSPEGKEVPEVWYMTGLSLGYREQPYLFDELDKMVAYAPICEGSSNIKIIPVLLSFRRRGVYMEPVSKWSPF